MYIYTDPKKISKDLNSAIAEHKRERDNTIKYETQYTRSSIANIIKRYKQDVTYMKMVKHNTKSIKEIQKSHKSDVAYYQKRLKINILSAHRTYARAVKQAEFEIRLVPVVANAHIRSKAHYGDHKFTLGALDRWNEQRIPRLEALRLIRAGNPVTRELMERINNGDCPQGIQENAGTNAGADWVENTRMFIRSVWENQEVPA